MLNEAFDLLTEARRRLSEGSGSMIVLSGESGIGKTFSVERFLSTLGGGDFVLRSKGRPETPNPLYPIYEPLVAFLKHSPALRNVLKQYAATVHRMASLLRPVLPDDGFLRGIEALVSPNLLEFSPYPHCLELIRVLAKGRPIVAWIDDVQWVDRETLRFIMYLCDQIQKAPMLWILCLNQRRPGILARDSLESALSFLRDGGGDVCRFLEFRRISRANVSDLIAGILGGPFLCQENVLDDLYSRSRGVPYILKTFLDVLRRSGSLSAGADGTYRVAASAHQLSLPESLRLAIQERLRSVYALMPESRSLLETAAVMGERFDDMAMEAVLNMCDSYRLLSLIEENHFLVRNLLDQRQWEFEHVTVRDFIYQTLGREATNLHRKLARYLIESNSEDYSQIAYHFSQAGDDESRISFQIRQAREWQRQGFFEEARRLYEELWSLPQFPQHPDYIDQRFDLEYERCCLYFHLAEYETCLQMIHQVAALEPERKDDPLLLLLRAKCLNKASNDRSFRQAREVLEGLRSRTDLRSQGLLLGRICAELVVSCGHLNCFPEARAAFAEAERRLNPFESPIEHAQLMRRSIMVLELELAEKVLHHTVNVFRRHRVDHEVVMSLNNLAALYYLQDRIQEAIPPLTEALALSARLSDFRSEYMLTNLSLVRLKLGDAEAALAGLRDAVAATRRPINRLVILSNQAAPLLKLGQAQAALDLLEGLLPEALASREDVYIVSIRLNLALAHLALEQPRSALLELAACDTTRLRRNWRVYDIRRGALLRCALDRVGALAAGEDGSGSRSILPEPHALDMQFWGD